MKHLYLWINVMIAFAIGACVAAVLPAQAQSENGVPVHAVVTVEAHKGSNMPVINREDVMVTEGKDRDQVVDWVPAQGDHADLEFFILIDDSSSTTLGTQFNDIKKFIDEQPASAKIGVAYMQNGVAQVAQNLTTDHEAAVKALRLPRGIFGAEASPYFSVTDLIKRWPADNARHEVLMVSNGVDPYYGVGDLQDPYLQTAIDDAQRAGIIICAIYTPGAGHFGHSYWLNYWGQLYLAELSEKTGGEAYYIGFTGAPVAFAPYLEDVANRLNHQFLLTFLAKPPKKAGLQRVKIRTEVPKVDLVAPKEVYIPAQ